MAGDSTSIRFDEVRPDIVDLAVDQYRNSSLVSHYRRDEGLLVIPVMGPPNDTKPVVVRVHAPIGYREATFNYAKRGSPPVFPAMADTASGDIILGGDFSLPAPVQADDGGLVFGCQGKYSFVQFENLRGTEVPYPIDAHPFFSWVDVMGMTTPGSYNDPSNNDYQGRYGTWGKNLMDSRVFGSYNLLG